MIFKMNFLKIKLLRNAFLISLVLLIGFPLINILYVYPVVTNQLYESVEDDAVHEANYLATMLIPDSSGINNGSVSDRLKQDIQWLIKNKIEKVKIFSKSGEVVYSTRLSPGFALVVINHEIGVVPSVESRNVASSSTVVPQ